MVPVLSLVSRLLAGAGACALAQPAAAFDTTFSYDQAGNNYLPWGEQWTSSGQAGDRQYNGRVYDPGTGFHDYGARMYWPQIGRFVSADSYQGDIAKPASLNRYAYVLNNPYKYVDPTGHFSVIPSIWDGPGPTQWFAKWSAKNQPSRV